jgi:hypothetical protein
MSVFDVERAKLPIEERVNEIMEATTKKYPNRDNYLLWVCAVDCV